MKKNRIWEGVCIFLVVSLFAVFALASSEDTSSNTTEESKTGIKSMYFDVSAINLEEGKTYSDNIEVDCNFTVSFDDIKIINASPNVALFECDDTIGAFSTRIEYLINAISPGETKIYVITKDGIIKSNTITITVTEKSPTTITTTMTEKSLSEKETTKKTEQQPTTKTIDVLGDSVTLLSSDRSYAIGASKANVKRLFSNFRITENYLPSYPYSIKFENSNLMICIDFDTNWIAEGAYVETYIVDDPITGRGSYVHKNYNKILKVIIGNENITVQDDTELYNSTGSRIYPTALFIGNYYE